MTIHRDLNPWRIRLAAPVAFSTAEQLKEALLDWLRSGQDLEVDFQEATAVDVAAMQLIWAAAREGRDKGASIRVRASEDAEKAIRDSGFAGALGFPEVGGLMEAGGAVE